MGQIYFKNLRKCLNISKHDFHGIIRGLNNSNYNCTNRTDDALCYGMIKFNKKKETIIIIDRNGTMIYDSSVGFLDLKILSLKNKFESDETNKLMAYLKPLLVSATDRVVVNTNNNQFFFCKLLTLNNFKIQNEVLTKKKIDGNWAKDIGCISVGLSALFTIYNCIKPNKTVRTSAQVTFHI